MFLSVYNTTYGAIKSISRSQANTLEKINPIRYRGYYYDNETGYYYLNSRYYNPSIGRFINADAYLSTGQGHGVLGFNMYAYCGNNPVLSMDPTGEMKIGSREYEDWKRQEEIKMQQRENTRLAGVRARRCFCTGY